MPTVPTGPMIAEAPPSPIENELPTYRAISNLAVFSLICGALSSFSFASLNFLALAVLAVVLGALANRAIQRSPDTLTGAGLANAGIGMGLVFGLIVVTYSSIQYVTIHRSASQFGGQYAQVLKSGTLGDTLLLGEPGDKRKGHTGAEREKEFEQMKQKDRMMMEQKLGPMLNLRKALTAKNAEIRIVGIEKQGVDESIPGDHLYYYALVHYQIDGAVPPPGVPHTEGTLHAMALLKGHREGGHFDWWVDDTRFPYIPESYQIESKPVDDGHGHAH